MIKPRILHYYSSSTQIGGPLTYINTLLNSEIGNAYELSACYQMTAPGGINIPLLNRMCTQIKVFAPDILHIHGLQSEGLYGLIAGRMAGCKNILVTVHGLASDTVEMNPIKKILYKYFVEPFTLQQADFVYCVCNHTSSRPLIRKNARKLLDTIHTGIAPLFPSKSKFQLRNEIGLPQNKLMGILVGRIVRDKGFGELSEVIHSLYQKGDERVRFCMVGEGGYTTRLNQQLKEEIAAGYVCMCGRHDNVADFLFASDFFLLPSWHENFPISLLEAAQAGLPAIATDVGGIPEIVDHGRTGLLIPKNDPATLMLAINQFLNDPSRMYAMGKNAKEKIETTFSLDAMVRKIQAVYSEILN